MPSLGCTICGIRMALVCDRLHCYQCCVCPSDIEESMMDDEDVYGDEPTE